MQRIRAALLVAVLLPLAPFALPASAQEPVATHLADDNAGDVKVDAQGQGTTPPADAFAPADLKALDVVETPDTFTFTLTVASLAPQAEGPGEGATMYYVNFLQHDRMYRLRVNRQVFLTTGYTARLEGFDAGRGGYYTLSPLEVQADPATGAVTVTVPRQSLLDANGAAPHPEIPITGFRATSTGLSGGTRSPKFGALANPVTVRDAMPDAGNATTELPVRFGVTQDGQARLSSDTPTRASNGEATTFVYQVVAANLGTKEDTYTLATSGVIPQGWSVKLPATQVTVPGNGSIVLPVLLTTPFTHTHGAFQNFVLVMTSINDAKSVGRIQLGVRYSQPPQPAGHHAQLWFHSESAAEDPATQQLFQAFGAGSDAFMNAQTDDPTDMKAEVVGENMGAIPPSGTGTAYAWEVPLSPGLEMGLDFDVTKRGAIEVKVKAPTPLPDAVLSGTLVHFGAPIPGENGAFGAQEGPMTVLADLTPTTPVQLQDTQSLSTEIVPRADADFVLFEKGASLMLLLNLTTSRPDAPFGTGHAAPTLVPGSTLTLPLFEYHDPVNDIFVSDVELVVDSAQDRYANPGQTVLFNLTLHNKGAAESNYNLDLIGTNVAWARLVPSQTAVTVPGGGSLTFAVIVKVPPDVRVPTNPAEEKPAADLVVSATSQADYNQHALARLYTSVDNEPHVDDAPWAAIVEQQATATAPTPGFEAAFALAGLALMAFAVSRRRR